MSARFPGLVIAGTYYPEIGFERNPESLQSIRDQIQSARPDYKDYHLRIDSLRLSQGIVCVEVDRLAEYLAATGSVVVRKTNPFSLNFITEVTRTETLVERQLPDNA